MSRQNRSAIFYLLTIIFVSCSVKDVNNTLNNLTIVSKKKIGQIEVGGPYVGIEVHNSYPMLNRISFYYPVANSIDVSQNYWEREKYRIMTAGIKIDDTLKTMLPKDIYEVTQTPYSVQFSKTIYETTFNIGYNFCKSNPAFTITYKIKNNSNTKKEYEFYTRMESVLRTSHTYTTIDMASSNYIEQNKSLVFEYNSEEAGDAILFVTNDGQLPAGFTSKIPSGNNLDSLWLNSDLNFSDEITSNDKLEKPVAAFTYKKVLAPNEEFKIVQIVGMLKNADVEESINDIIIKYKNDISNYEKAVLEYSQLGNLINTGDKSLDFTSRWAKAILNTNAHFIDNDIVPMPAQAEYNFYFTHDALLTDLAAVFFDVKRVEADLEFIMKHADSDYIIPHAYYWKDTAYKTEYCGPENWNHFWFTIVASRYFKHSKDYELCTKIYPYVKKSIDTALENRGDDNLMWSFRPDWWDIGNNYGPKAYMTILAARALTEFCYLSSSLGMDEGKIQKYHSISDSLTINLNMKLWNDELNYLTSFHNDGSEDEHIYMGSMLAAHFDLLSRKKNEELLATAKQHLLDENIGVYTLYPMDLHKLGDYMGFSGDEAGEPYYYANGGIWPHGNAWYALGLINIEKREEAFNFIKNNMTIDGINNSPNGQPALYEYRISDKNDPEVYGKIDKPQFLWAGGWYIYTLYNLLGVKENVWNISIIPYLPFGMNQSNLHFVLNGQLVNIFIKGKGERINKFVIDDKNIPSVVIPNDLLNINKIVIELGEIKYPYLLNSNAVVEQVSYDNEKKLLEFQLSSLENIQKDFQILSPFNCKIISCDEQKNTDFNCELEDDGVYKITYSEISPNKISTYKVYFN